ncbi:MAG TPA: arabinan endo-1,5-alpha-L-arabinosidase [Actinoplanes sp.]
MKIPPRLAAVAAGIMLAVPLALVPTTAALAYPGPGVVTGDTTVHDPEVTKTPSGSYLLVHTGQGLTIKTSTDRTAWRNAGRVFPNGASWTDTYRGSNRDLWAPDITYANGQYYLYYSASSFGSNRSAIFLATSSSGASGSWVHRGLVIESRTSDNWNAIDPNLIIDNGRWYLSFGSFWSGIKQIDLNSGNGLRSGSAFRSIAGRNGGAIEAPTIHKRGSYYYQFVSFDRCCAGASSTYRIMVGRSNSVTGPYYDRNGVNMNNGGGTEILAGQGSIHGPGHQAVLADTDADALFYHYYTNSGASRLGINLLRYDSAGWPVVY